MSDGGREPIRVLHVDDQPEFAAMLADFLERERDAIEVTTEPNACAAIERLERADADCVVSDYEMPDTDGLELLDRVREEYADLPFILFTAKGSEEIASEAISRGVTDYLQKGGAEQYTLLANRIVQAVSRYRAEASYREIFEKATDGIAVHDPETGEIIDVNARFCEMVGYDREALVGRTVDRFSPDDADYSPAEARRRIRRAVEEGSRSFEWVAETAAGDCFPVEVNLKRTTLRGRERVLALVRDVTERKERERALREERDRRAVLFENLPDAAVEYEYENGGPVVRAANAAFAETFGYDPEAAVGTPIDDLVVPPDRREEAETIDERVREGARLDVELERQTASGELRSFRFRNIPIDRETESKPGYAVYTDVTERKERERALAALHDVATEMETCGDRAAVYELVVRAAEDILAYDYAIVDEQDGDVLVPRATSTGLSEGEYFDRTPVDAEDNVAARVFRTGEASLVDDLADRDVASADPSYRSALTVPIGEHGVFQAAARAPGAFDETDLELAEILATHAATTLDRLRSAADLQAERDRFAALFRNLPAPAVEAVLEEGEPVVRAVNPAFEAVFGYDAEAVVGERLDDLVVPPDRRDEAATLNRRTLADERLDVEVTRQTADGPREFRLVTAQVPTGTDEPDRGYGIYQDITERKERERALARQNERLEEFAGIVSHDLRNPLNVAEGRVELAREDCESDHLDMAYDALDRIDRIVENTLTLARQGQVVGETEPVALSSLAERCWSTVETADADLDVAADGTITADPDRLEHLFENLFRNAVEHAGPDATVRVDALADRDGFYVADDGPGVPEDERDRVFEAGYSTAETGTGLGLAIVRRIAEAHGWEVAATEGADGGARFEIRDVAPAAEDS